MNAVADLTLDELRLELAPAIVDAVPFDGWSEAAVDSAALARNADPAVARLAFPGGAMDMVCAWIDSVDRAMDEAFTVETLGQLKVRERIRALVQFRLDAIAGREEALKRALAVMALPPNLARSLKAGWSSADRMWRLAGDTATDYNHYTKRAILAAIYGATLAVFADDTSDGKAETRAFLERRIEDVMQFEKAKAQLLQSRDGFSVTRFLGRLRYPAR